MMTFLPFADFKASAEALDTKRLQNQRTEARFVLEWLENRGFDLRACGAASCVDDASWVRRASAQVRRGADVERLPRRIGRVL